MSQNYVPDFRGALVVLAVVVVMKWVEQSQLLVFKTMAKNRV